MPLTVATDVSPFRRAQGPEPVEGKAKGTTASLLLGSYERSWSPLAWIIHSLALVATLAKRAAQAATK